MEALRQTLVLGACQVILPKVFQASLCTLKRDLFLILASAIVLLQLLVKDITQLIEFTLVDVLINLLVKSFLRATR